MVAIPEIPGRSYDFAELIHAVRKYPRMFLLDERFHSFIALWVGFDAATDGSFFEEFQGWVSARVGAPGSSLHWSALIKERARQQHADWESHAIARSLDMLEEFTQEQRSRAS